MPTRSTLFVAAIFAFSLSMASSAFALPAVGAAQPQGTVVDADGNKLDLKKPSGKPTLFVYESKESATQNEVLKAELSALAKGDKYRKAIRLIPIADVDGYDYWPARGFVKSAIREESAKLKTTIYCDWDGSFRKAAGFKRDTSSVVLVGKNGKVLFAYEGGVPEGERKKLIELLKVESAEEVAAAPSGTPSAAPAPSVPAPQPAPSAAPSAPPAAPKP
jgi:Bacterial protein of unknown function (YtfJ_HI0045)